MNKKQVTYAIQARYKEDIESLTPRFEAAIKKLDNNSEMEFIECMTTSWVIEYFQRKYCKYKVNFVSNYNKRKILHGFVLKKL